MPTSPTVEALQQAAGDLVYQSEADAHWKVFSWPGAKGEPTGAEVRRRGRYKANATVTEQTLDEFFAPLVQEQDWYRDEESAIAGKYQELLETVKRSLQNPKVFRIGERKIAVYVVGVAPEGGWAGLKTTAVET